MSGEWNISGSAQDQRIVEALQKLFETENGERALGKIRLRYGFDDNGSFEIRGFLGDHAGPELDLMNRKQTPSDEKARLVLSAIAEFTDEQIAEALCNQFLWNFDRTYCLDCDGTVIEYSTGNENFSAESIHSIAQLANKI